MASISQSSSARLHKGFANSNILDGLTRSLSAYPTVRDRSVLIAQEGDCKLMGDVLDFIRREYPTISLFQLPSSTPTDLTPLEAPLASKWFMRRLLRHLRVCAIVVKGDTKIPASLFELAASMGIKLISLGVPGEALAQCGRRVSVCAIEPGERDQVAEIGVPESALVINGQSHRLLDQVAPLLIGKRKGDKMMHSLPALQLRAWLKGRRFDRIDSLPALADKLGNPRTILCLGSGPSGEDPELMELAYDVMFRVNHAWLDRSHHTSPDVIFTGKTKTLTAYPRETIYGFQSESAARRIMLKSSPVSKRLRYFTADRLGSMDFDCFAPYIPTNGAVMIATAIALKPERLIVAGVDMFSDPRGSYPGDEKTPNAYIVAHSGDIETHFILETLNAFEGELVIVGDVLKNRLREFRDDAAA